MSSIELNCGLFPLSCSLKKKKRMQVQKIKPGQLKLLDGSSLAYKLIEGDPSKPILIFLHEGLGCTEMWKAFPSKLCLKTGYPGLMYDRIGYGQSSALKNDRTTHYLHDYATFELPQLIEKLLPNRTYFLIGHSDGGSISLIHASTQDPSIRGVITEAAHVFVEDITLNGIKFALEEFRVGRLISLQKYHGKKTESIFYAWADTWLKSEFLHWNIEYLLPSIKCPVLAIQGKNDQYGTELQLDKIVSGVGKVGTKMMIDNCGHAPHRDQPGLVLGAMSEFILGLS